MPVMVTGVSAPVRTGVKSCCFRVSQFLAKKRQAFPSQAGRTLQDRVQQEVSALRDAFHMQHASRQPVYAVQQRSPNSVRHQWSGQMHTCVSSALHSCNRWADMLSLRKLSSRSSLRAATSCRKRSCKVRPARGGNACLFLLS